MFAIPVLFTEVSPGLHGSPFRMVKFRTMTDASYANGALMPDSQRLTPFADGVFAALYTRAGTLPRGAPELTGWAQVNGSNAIICADKFVHDVWYFDHRSLWLDVHILWLTVRRVLVRDGISAPGDAKMPKFDEAQKQPCICACFIRNRLRLLCAGYPRHGHLNDENHV